eukprot:TRINITY_DN18910_c0_g1_i1.p1 TRINITY_DN18910_c0_g1~~TRINITY_DN18910_c0_g1_i1.p1  ORF type:complete len:189 (+),score=62.73 TRINITY_DN18910_c0_g1_i1:108-674(+)
MVKYAREPVNPAKTAKARGSSLRCHFKNTRETAMALKGMNLHRARAFLNAVLEKKETVPFRRFCGSAGRNAQSKQHGHYGPARWPAKSAKFLLDLVQNAESNAERKSLDVDALALTHIQVNRAQHGRRRTYRAHGRINAYKSSPCHIELFFTEQDVAVVRPEEEKAAKKVSKKKLQKERLRSGGRQME